MCFNGLTHLQAHEQICLHVAQALINNIVYMYKNACLISDTVYMYM